jgi:hypothetical protein
MFGRPAASARRGIMGLERGGSHCRVWSVAQNLRYVSREEAEKASGLKIEGWV